MIVDYALYQNGRRTHLDANRDDLFEFAEAEGGFVWVGLAEPTHEEFEHITKEFNFHPLAIEDAVHAQQRPKIEDYEGLTFFVVKTAFYEEKGSQVTTGEILVFLGEKFIVVVRHGDATPLATVRHKLESQPQFLAQGPFAVLHAILDSAIDCYIQIAAELENDVIEVEKRVFSGKRQTLSQSIYILKREILEFRHAIDPLQVPLNKLVGEATHLAPTAMAPFFRDTLDHLARASDVAAGLDSLLTSALHADLAHVQVQQNEDMRRIASWVALGVAPTMIAGIYGMNFEHMPELAWRYGYPTVLGGIVIFTGLLYRNFKKSGWL